MSMETISAKDLFNKTIEQIENAQTQLPSQFNSNFDRNSTSLFRVC